MAEKKRIISEIVAKDNQFLKDLELCKDNGYTTYIYGNGEGADNVERRAISSGISFSGRVVDKRFFRPSDNAYCLEETIGNLRENEKINLVVAYRGFSREKLAEFQDKLGVVVDRDCFSGNYDVDPELMTFAYVKDHEKELQAVWDSLEDIESQESLAAYVNQKISMDYEYLKKVKHNHQYFENALIHFQEGEAFVDAGGYIGDTAKEFIEALRRQGIQAYDAIYSFEPDESNYEKLKNSGLEKHDCYQLGTSDREETLFFSSVGKGSSSLITNEESDVVIKTDTLDHVLEGKKVTFIKMDVEGAELASLKGARSIISKQRPKLAICIYHKKEDLWEIMDYIKTLVPDYKYYIRAYEYTATELVLYAV